MNNVRDIKICNNPNTLSFCTVKRLLASALIIVSLATLLSGCEAKKLSQRDYEMMQIQALTSGHAGSSAALNMGAIKRQALTEEAASLGARAGLAYRSNQINQMLKQQEQTLDDTYNFRGLILHNNVLPPVLIEGHNSLNLAGPNTIRAAQRTYQIVSPPHFVTAAPTWRDYLWMNYKAPDLPSKALLPSNDAERKIWNASIKQGWQNGVIQGNSIFSTNLGRLKRDYTGMILYRKLLKQNIVSAPFVAQADLGVTDDSEDVRINDRILRITALSSLNPNSSTWKTIIRHEPTIQPDHKTSWK